MNFKILERVRFGSGLLVGLGVFALAGSLPAVALAQSVSPSAVSPDTVQLGEGTGGAGYAAPANVYVPQSSIENPADAGVSMHTDYVLLGTNGGTPASAGTP